MLGIFLIVLQDRLEPVCRHFSFALDEKKNPIYESGIGSGIGIGIEFGSGIGIGRQRSWMLNSERPSAWEKIVCQIATLTLITIFPLSSIRNNLV
jgi:hypothetical protein